MSSILKAENLCKSYQMHKKLRLDVLKDVSMEIEANKISVIVGASGAGKSTLLHLLGALDRPVSGQIRYKDRNIFSLSDNQLAKFRNKNIGFILLLNFNLTAKFFNNFVFLKSLHLYR